jgi:hypothetical protein
MSPATHEDANLLVQLAQWGAMIDLGPALGTIFDEAFDPDTAEMGDPPVRTILAYGETIGTLVKHEVLDRALVLDWLWVQGLWERVGPAAMRAREQLGTDALYENFEALAQAQGGQA